MTTKLTTECPFARDVSLLMSGRLTDEQIVAVETHLDGCPHCQLVIELTTVDGRLLRALKEEVTAEKADRLPNEVIDRLERLTVTPSQWSPASVGSDVRFTLPPPQEPGEIGRLAHYRIIELIGSGGMGLVYRAEDDRLLRPVALKLMRPRLARHHAARERFLREARAMAALKHDNVVTVFEVGEAEGASPDQVIPYLSMELLHGESLAQWMRRHPPAPWEWVARIGRQAAAGLAAAHARELIHRDVKPANLWLEAPRERTDADSISRAAVARVKLLDFGLADPLGPTASAGGTPAYIPPEQARGEPLDPRADLYALGVVLYELATGRLPDSATPLVPVRLLAPSISPALARLIERLLSSNPADRPNTAREVEQALSAMCPPEWDTPARRRWRRILTAVAIVAMVGITVIHLTPQSNPPASQNETPARAAGFSDDDWIREVGQMPPEHRYAAVLAKLRERNPGFQGPAPRVGLQNDEVVELALPTDAIIDVEPLRALPRLRTLSLTGSKPGAGRLIDLSPLRRLPLETLDVSENPHLSDLTPLAGMELTSLRISGTAVADFSVVRSLPRLQQLNGEPFLRK